MLAWGECLEAYILINAEPGMIWKVAEAALKIEGVKLAHAVTGQFDDVIFVEFAKMEDLGKIIRKLHSIEGVRRTQTLITIPPTIRE
ncbi:MAG: Lrp/AsnC ligand binding domain-containing protein [Candidatus Bathyarchaeota archaeon]|nr:Lrp/AsnC ligand binding domain-containing protein [Candidatus Bathyarchaeota archaeon]